MKSAGSSQATKQRLDKVKRIFEQAGLHVKRTYEKVYREYVVILTDGGLHGEEEKLYELGLTVTSIHLSKTDKHIDEEDGKECTLLWMLQDILPNKNTIPIDVIPKEIDFMLHSKDSRWIQNHQLVESPF
ncbi:MAG: hypothetical protein WA941_01405 [Nitrososphaeraceae archaeon]